MADNKQDKDVTAKAVIEVLGKPKEHVEKTMKDILDMLKKGEVKEGAKKAKYELLKAQIYEAEKSGDVLWSGIMDLELKFRDLESLIGFCFDYMPSSIDIAEPKKIEFDATTMNGLLNDLIAQVHKYDMLYKKLRAANLLLQKKLNELKEEK